MNEVTFETIRVPDGMKFDDLSNEQSRSYRFPQEEIVTITSPVALNVSRSGGHRVIAADGEVHYIPKGWLKLSWIPREGTTHIDF